MNEQEVWAVCAQTTVAMEHDHLLMCIPFTGGLFTETGLLKLLGWFILKILLLVSQRKLSPAHIGIGN